MWRCVVWSIVTEVSEEHAVSIFGVIIYRITQRHVLKILIIVVTTTRIVYLVSITVFMLEASVSKNFVLWYRLLQVSLDHIIRNVVKKWTISVTSKYYLMQFYMISGTVTKSNVVEDICMWRRPFWLSIYGTMVEQTPTSRKIQVFRQ
jgi:hypothetical protein